MAGTFDHDLNTGILCPLGKLSQQDQFMDLSAVGRIGKAARTESVAKREGQVVLPGYLDQSVEMLEERVFGIVVSHPLDGEGAAAGNDIHDPSFVLHPLHRASGDTAVYGNEIHTVLGMLDDAGEHLLHGHVDD